MPWLASYFFNPASVIARHCAWLAAFCAALLFLPGSVSAADDSLGPKISSPHVDREDAAAVEVIEYDGGDLKPLVGKRLRARGRLMEHSTLLGDNLHLHLMTTSDDVRPALLRLDGMNVEIVGRVREMKLRWMRRHIDDEGRVRGLGPEQHEVSIFSVDIEEVTALPARFQHVGWGEAKHGLQLGLRLATATTKFRHGDTMGFHVLLKNTTNGAMKVRFWPLNDWNLETDDSPRLKLCRVRKSHEDVSPATLMLQPNQVRRIDHGHGGWIVPTFEIAAPIVRENRGKSSEEPHYPQLAPGRYQVHVPAFGIQIMENEGEAREVEYATGELEFEIAPREKP